jgi:predicted secreted protein
MTLTQLPVYSRGDYVIKIMRRLQMKKVALIAVVALVFGMVLSGCAKGRETIPTYSDPAQPITVNVGQQFVIYLPYSPDTGFTWQEEYDSSKLELVQSLCALCQAGQLQFLQGQGYDISGGYANIPPSAQFSQFKALNKGETKITMAYKNSPTAEPVETQTFTVTIQ